VQVHALGLLRFVLTHLSYDGRVISLQQAVDVEARCLDALEWRLGPFFLEDDITGELHEPENRPPWCECTAQRVNKSRAARFCWLRRLYLTVTSYYQWHWLAHEHGIFDLHDWFAVGFCFL
jgi:hypothetical protein